MHVNLTKTDDKWITTEICPDCKKRSRFLNFYQEWYGVDCTCLKCGRSFCEGEWMALGFYRGSRKDNINAAKKRWRKSNEI